MLGKVLSVLCSFFQSVLTILPRKHCYHFQFTNKKIMVKRLAQIHIMSEWYSWDVNSDNLAPEPMLWTAVPYQLLEENYTLNLLYSYVHRSIPWNLSTTIYPTPRKKKWRLSPENSSLRESWKLKSINYSIIRKPILLHIEESLYYALSINCFSRKIFPILP